MEQKKHRIQQAKLLKIKTEQFAVFEENLTIEKNNPDGTPLLMSVSAQFGGNIEEKGASSSLKFEILQNDKPIVLIESTMYFSFTESDWKKMYNQKKNTLTIPQLTACYLFSNVISTCRGILFEKMAGKKLQNMYIPVIHAEDYVDENVEISFD